MCGRHSSTARHPLHLHHPQPHYSPRAPLWPGVLPIMVCTLCTLCILSALAHALSQRPTPSFFVTVPSFVPFTGGLHATAPLDLTGAVFGSTHLPMGRTGPQTSVFSAMDISVVDGTRLRPVRVDLPIRRRVAPRTTGAPGSAPCPEATQDGYLGAIWVSWSGARTPNPSTVKYRSLLS